MGNLIQFFLFTILTDVIKASYMSSPPLEAFHFSEAQEDIDSTRNASKSHRQSRLFFSYAKT